MHLIEPYYLWRNLYQSSRDKLSPFYGRQYSELYFTNHVYDHYIHPQWDHFGSETLFMKVLFVDYEESYCVLEFIGEWNDCLHNDIMILKREIIDLLVAEGIRKFILIGENVLNFHASDESYYEEWLEDTEGGWVALINFHQHVLAEMRRNRLHFYLNFGNALDDFTWRQLQPSDFFQLVERSITSNLIED